jgi:hypothetical protein
MDNEIRIDELIAKYKQNDTEWIENNKYRINRMRDFYSAKAPDAPGNQQYMFIGFVHALEFALDVIKDYEELIAEMDKNAAR